MTIPHIALVVLALVACGLYLVLRARANKPRGPKTAREWYELQTKLDEERERDRGLYLSTHGPRPAWDGSKSGER